MTQRLPIPGQDDGTWGDILNGFLEVSLNSDGTLSTSAVTTALPSPIPTTNLGSGTASSSNFLRGDGTWAVPNSGSSSLAADTDVAIVSPANNQVLTYNSGAGKWENIAPAVSTVFGRTGAVVATTGDYTAAQVTGALVNTNNLSDVSNTTTARGNLTAAKSGANSDITSLTGLTTPLAVSEGGTGANTLTGVVVGSGTSALTTVTAPAGTIVGTSDTQTLTNKNLTSGTNTFPTFNQNTTGNAATVTTNANLTGPITSTGNTTAVAAQTGTGSTFVMSASPTLSGTPLAPTATAGTNTTQVATTAFVQTAIALINTVATSGSAQTLQAETMNHITLSTNCTLTLPIATAGSWFIASFIQPASGGPYTPTITSADYGASGTPTWSTAASKKDIVVGICDDGSTWDVALIATGGF